MLYVQRFIRGIAELPSADPALRENLQQQLQQQGAIALHERLRNLMVAAAKFIPTIISDYCGR